MKPENRTWIDRTGNHFKMSEMSLSYLKACLAMCKRKNWRIEQIPHLEAWILFHEVGETPLYKALREE